MLSLGASDGCIEESTFLDGIAGRLNGAVARCEGGPSDRSAGGAIAAGRGGWRFSSTWWPMPSTSMPATRVR